MSSNWPHIRYYYYYCHKQGYRIDNAKYYRIDIIINNYNQHSKIFKQQYILYGALFMAYMAHNHPLRH